MDEEEKIRFDEEIRGTPEQFWIVAKTFEVTWKTWIIRDSLRGRPFIRASVQGKSGDAYITLIPMPNGGTQLRVTATGADWAIFEPLWLAILAELKRLGFTDAPQGRAQKKRTWKVPNRGRSERDTWNKIWEIARAVKDQGIITPSAVQAHLDEHYPQLTESRSTISRILTAGREGELD